MRKGKEGRVETKGTCLGCQRLTHTATLTWMVSFSTYPSFSIDPLINGEKNTKQVCAEVKMRGTKCMDTQTGVGECLCSAQIYILHISYRHHHNA